MRGALIEGWNPLNSWDGYIFKIRHRLPANGSKVRVRIDMAAEGLKGVFFFSGEDGLPRQVRLCATLFPGPGDARRSASPG
jgi:hypothetical protein